MGISLLEEGINALNALRDENMRIKSQLNEIERLKSKDIKLPLYVRNRRDGDKIEVKGLNGRKKVSDIFIDEKGVLSEYPTDFLDEWNNQTMELMKP